MNHVLMLFRRFLQSFGRMQIERPWVVALLAVAMTAPAVVAARGLGLKTDFSELLPDNKPSVVEMRRVSEKLTSASTLTIVVQVPASHPQALQAFADPVVPKIQ